MLKNKKWALAAIALLMAFTLTGCLGKVYTNVLTVKGLTATTDESMVVLEDFSGSVGQSYAHKISSGMYLTCQMMAYQEAVNTSTDEKTPILKQTIDGKKAVDWIHDKTLELILSYVSVRDLCAQKGVTLTKASIQTLDSELDTNWQSAAAIYTENGISKSTLRDYMLTESYSKLLFTELYGKGGEKAPTREQLSDRQAEKNAHLRAFVVSLADANGEELEAADEAREMIDAMLKEMKDGDKSLNDAFRQNLPFINAALNPDSETEPTIAEPELDEDGEEVPPAEISSYFLPYLRTESSLYTDEFLEGLKKEDVGSFGKFEVQNQVLIYEKVETFDTEETYDTWYESLLQENYTEDFKAYVKTVYDAYEVEWVFGAQWFYSPKKIKITQTNPYQ